MRKFIFILFLLFYFGFTIHLDSQAISISNAESTPDASSILDIQSADKGLLIPRIFLDDVSITMIDGVNVAAIGLLIYNKNPAVIGGSGMGFYSFNGFTWEKLITESTAGVIDIDFYEEGTTGPPNDINDDMFTHGNLGIGTETPQFPIDVSSVGKRGMNTLMNGEGDKNVYGNYVKNNDIGSAEHYGTYNALTGSGIGIQYGSYQAITNSGDAAHYGNNNVLSGLGNGLQVGTYQEISNSGIGAHYGSSNNLTGSGSGAQIGSIQEISNSGNAPHYGSSNNLTGSGSGSQIGSLQSISNSGNGSHHGSFNILTGTGNGIQYGSKQKILNSGDAAHYGSHNELSGIGVGIQYGSYQEISNSGNADHYGNNNMLLGTGNGDQYGTFQEILNEGNGLHYGSYNFLSGSGSGAQYGARQLISNTGDGNHFGIHNTLSGSGDGEQYGSYQEISNTGSGDQYGSYNGVVNFGTGQKYGSYQDIYSSSASLAMGSYNRMLGSASNTRYGTYQSLGGTGSGTHFGNYNLLADTGDGWQYGTTNYITNSGDGNKYGCWNEISSQSSQGIQYGVYSNVLKADSYAGYFLGNVYIGDFGAAISSRPKFQVTGGNDASFTNGSGFLTLGQQDDLNVVLDDNEILARDNGASSTLYVQRDGGDLLLAGEELGAVGIGVSSALNLPPGYLLAVDGDIIVEDVTVELSQNWPWPDYVFQPDYVLESLPELEQRINRDGHLPGIPSAQVIEEVGFDLGKMQTMVLEKVEELTLYMIQADKEMKLLKKENLILSERLEKLEIK